MAEATSPKEEDEQSGDNSCCNCTEKLTHQYESYSCCVCWDKLTQSEFLRRVFCEGLQGQSRRDELWKQQLDVSIVQFVPFDNFTSHDTQ